MKYIHILDIVEKMAIIDYRYWKNIFKRSIFYVAKTHVWRITIFNGQIKLIS